MILYWANTSPNECVCFAVFYSGYFDIFSMYTETGRIRPFSMITAAHLGPMRTTITFHTSIITPWLKNTSSPFSFNGPGHFF